jgi:RNA polymerase sigma factor (sigma-70 family)
VRRAAVCKAVAQLLEPEEMLSEVPVGDTSAVLTQTKAGAIGRKKDRGFLDALYRKHWKGLCGYLHVRFGAAPPDAADVAQSAFAKLAALKAVSAVQNPKAFLYATARNLAIDQRRRAQTHQAYSQARIASQDENLDGMTPERVFIGKETLDIMREAIRRLPHKQRRVLLLHRLHKQSFTEISQRTGWSHSDVRRQMCRAMAAIERALDGAGR